MAIGSFVLVLHGHVPYVLKHGRWPHGDHWVFEAAAETYLPLLEVIESCRAAGGRCPITLGLTPVLLEQLSHPYFKERFPLWLAEREERAHRDEQEFESWGDAHLVSLARRWADRYEQLNSLFSAIKGDLPGAFAQLWNDGQIELISSSATHGYTPLLLQDSSIRAQIRMGLKTSERVLGRRPSGYWLPECAYRPGGPWTPAVGQTPSRVRLGTDQHLAREGVKFTILDAQLFRGARSEGIRTHDGYLKVGWDQAAWDVGRVWRSVLEPHIASTDGTDTDLSVFGRHPEVSEQVWSGQVGYPADGRYLEFHKKHGSDGLRYWKVTSARAGLGEKERYSPEDVHGAVFSHAQHFCSVVRGILRQHHERHGREGVVVAPFDAELFGHWWAEGPIFLRDVMLTLNADPEITVRTASEQLAALPADKVAWFPEGSWGAGGDHRVWLNDDLKWMWEVIYQAESRFGELCLTLPWREGGELETLLKDAARELLLLQASDWPFVITTKGAPDYGIKRFSGHATRFDRLCDMAQTVAKGEILSETDLAVLNEARACDDIFPDLDLNLWGE